KRRKSRHEELHALEKKEKIRPELNEVFALLTSRLSHLSLSFFSLPLFLSFLSLSFFLLLEPSFPLSFFLFSLSLSSFSFMCVVTCLHDFLSFFFFFFFFLSFSLRKTSYPLDLAFSRCREISFFSPRDFFSFLSATRRRRSESLPPTPHTFRHKRQAAADSFVKKKKERERERKESQRKKERVLSFSV
ncbi:hypothetical protein CSUI_010509, partial [Cystoisospora suis]